jgi:hypothetical protein
MNFIFENKKKYFHIIFIISVILNNIFFLLFYSINLICLFISIIVWLIIKLLF